MFVLCIAYVVVSVCSDLPWHVKIASPTALSASAFRPVSSAIAFAQFLDHQISTKYHSLQNTPLLFVDTPVQAQV